MNRELLPHCYLIPSFTTQTHTHSLTHTTLLQSNIISGSGGATSGSGSGSGSNVGKFDNIAGAAGPAGAFFFGSKGELYGILSHVTFAT